MPLPRVGRTAYNPVASSEDVHDDEQRHLSSSEQSAMGRPNNASLPQRHRSQAATSTSTRTVPMEALSKEDTPLNSKALLDADTGNDDEDNDTIDTADTNITVIILDSAQKKFPVACHSQWTVGKFKKISAKIHKIAPSQQRLIFRGKMLTNDSQSLEEVKIDTDNVIIHLFPKPRVVVTSNDGSNISDACTMPSHDVASGSDSRGGGTVGGAHIPSIVIDQDEQERRGQILVLGSVEIAESQNNVKMLSLLLLVICSMRLLELFSIAMGVAEEPATGDHSNSTHAYPNAGGGNSNIPNNEPAMEPREWQTSDFFNFAVSAIGFYVATLGMKATQENTLRLANAYMIGTIIAGIGWNVWNVFMYIMFYEQEIAPSDDDDLPPLTRDDFITVAFFTVAMPLLVWGVCCARAWEFRRLIEEAEEEASERIRSQLTITVEEGGGEGELNRPSASREMRELAVLPATQTEIV